MACSKRVAPAPAAPSAGRHPVVRAITYENLEGVAPQEVARYFRERGVSLSVERPYQPEDVETETTDARSVWLPLPRSGNRSRRKRHD